MVNNPFINSNYSVHTVNVDGCQIICLDNFLSDPEAFRNYAFELSAPGVRERYITDSGSGYQLHMTGEELDAKFPEFRKSLTFLVHEFMSDEIKSTFGLDDSYSRMNIETGPGFYFRHRSPGKCPHVDPNHISTFLYLNEPDLCNGGTGIYRHIPTGKTRLVQDECSLKHIEMEHPEISISKSAGEWELLHKIEMRYNRLCMFNGSIIHKIYLEHNEHPYVNEMKKMRLSLNTFFSYARP